MNTQPEALQRIADLEAMQERGTIRRGHIDEMLSELRRLHEANQELLEALQDLLMDTQHSEHECGDKNCPVSHARAVALKYDAIRARGQA